MKISLNGETTIVDSGITVSDVVAQLVETPPGGRGIAVAVDAQVVPHSQWDTTEVSDGARVEIVRAMQGG